MKREIKFRVWVEYEINGTLRGNMEHDGSWFLMDQQGRLLSYGPMRPPRYCIYEYTKAIPLYYIGLHDKNGKEIYEGDIIDFGNWDDGDGERAIIEFDNARCGYIFSFYSKHGGEGYEDICNELYRKGKGITVIGNIYENPELLKGESK